MPQTIRSFHHRDFADTAAWVRRKEQLGLRVSLCIPTLNEEGTIARVVSILREELVVRHSLLDELVVIDSGSSDRTRALAAEAGAEVILAGEILPFQGKRMGKGENLWKAVHHLSGDILCFVDGDIGNIHPRFVLGTVGPLLMEPELAYVKGFYERPLLAAEGVDPRGGGRVTEILVRPLFARFCAELSALHQPLAGEYAARREILEQLPFPTGYGVETAHLVDVWRLLGCGALGQTDLDERIHRNRSLAQLGRMSGEILEAFLARFPQAGSGENERPPMNSLVEYLQRFPAAAERVRQSA
jgi:glucosyl-3-phosphoglycerate synthase